MSIKWTDPPTPGKAARTDYNEVTRQLKEQPGRWALILENVSKTARDALRIRGCEVRITEIARDGHRRDNQRCDVYARWPVPNGDSE